MVRWCGRFSSKEALLAGARLGDRIMGLCKAVVARDGGREAHLAAQVVDLRLEVLLSGEEAILEKDCARGERRGSGVGRGDGHEGGIGSASQGRQCRGQAAISRLVRMLSARSGPGDGLR